MRSTSLAARDALQERPDGLLEGRSHGRHFDPVERVEVAGEPRAEAAGDRRRLGASLERQRRERGGAQRVPFDGEVDGADGGLDLVDAQHVVSCGEVHDIQIAAAA